MTLLILDWLINLEPEIRLVWSSRWGYGKWLYLLCRYVSFFDIPFVLYHSLAANISPKQCQTLFMIITILTLITISAAESVLVLRTYALWNCDRRFLISLTTLWTIFAFTSLCISLTLTPTIRYAAQPVPSLPGCFPIAGSKVLSVNHGLVAIFETIIVTLTVYRGLTHFRGSNSHLVRVLYRDGITYFVLIFLCSVINVVIRLAFNRPYEMVCR
ncbi:hypothetical protein PLICRDRAFT_523352 [Plicaturopsis crispa FD-325 SS-3]|nr:hypothetical protein PLICRDRAFT_523352 [Plicaturopsis crispa FD-325 SS-3]